ncbi:MAG: PDGLE domain-containing protein [Baekduiaceae bacterium]
MRRTVFILCAIGVSLALATVVSPWASSHPDGLEKVADQQQFLDSARQAGVQQQAPAPDYAFPGVRDASAATAAAGVTGTLLVLAAGTGIGLLVARRRTGES